MDRAKDRAKQKAKMLRENDARTFAKSLQSQNVFGYQESDDQKILFEPPVQNVSIGFKYRIGLYLHINLYLKPI